MRIPKLFAAVAAVSLAVGASVSVGLTAAADPPSGWTIDSITAPLYPGDTLEFSGPRPVESVVDDVTVTPFESAELSASCTGLDFGNVEFTCSLTPPTDFAVGDGTITFYQGSDSFQVPFTVSGAPEAPPELASGPPTMSYVFSPGGVTAYGQPIAPATKVAIGFYEFLPEAEDQWDVAGGCPIPNSAEEETDGTFAGVVTGATSCGLSGLPAGIWNIYSQQDIGDGATGTGDFADDYFVIPSTPTIDTAHENWDSSVYLSGTAALGYEVRLLDNGSPVDCEVTGGEGGWYCTTAPLAQGVHSFSAYLVDSGAGEDPSVPGSTYVSGGQSALSASVDVPVDLSRPTVDYEMVPGGFTVTTTVVGEATVARTDLYLEGDYYYTWTDSCGGPAPELSEGYYWEGDPFFGIEPDQDNYGCSFLDLAPGPWTIESHQDDGSGEIQWDSTSDTFVIGSTPTIDGWATDEGDGIVIYGVATPGFLVHVVDAEGQEVCEPVEADEEGYWSCSTGSLDPAIYVVSAYTEDIGAGVDSLPYYSSVNYSVGGLSALSDSVVVNAGVPLIPAMSYEFVPGGVVIDGVPTGDATVIRTDLYSWAAGPGFQVVDNCGGPASPDSDDEGDWEGFEPFLGITPGPTHCVFTDLAPGVWNPYSTQDIGDGATSQDEWADDYFVVPATPTLATAVVGATGKVTLSGTTVPGNSVHVLNGAIQIVCDSAPTGETGAWTCTTPVLPNGSYAFRAYSEDLGAGENESVPGSVYLAHGLSNLSPAKTATVAIAPVPGTGDTPPTVTPPLLLTPSWFFTLTGIDFSNMHPGDTFTISGSGLPAGATISAELHSTPVSLGKATVGSTGSFALSATVPESTEPGDHTVVVTLTGDGLAPTTHEQAVTVTAASETAGHAAEGSGTVDDAHGEATDGHGSGDDSSATAPNILTNSMNPIVEVLSDPGRIPAAFAAGLVLIIFAIVPAHLLNSTVAEQYERLTRRMPRLKTAPRWYTGLTKAIAKAPVLGGILLMAATGFLFALADPHFGANLHSLRLIIALSAALFVVFFIANAITSAIMRRAWNIDVVVKLRPFGLVLTVAGVIVSRMLEFSPGFLIGIVLGLSIATSAAAHHAWKAVLIRTSVIVTFGIISWIIYSSIAEGVHHDPTFFNEVVLEFFVAIATEGIVLLLVELLPLHMLEGERLFKRSRVLWAAVYLVVLTMFILAVVPWAGNWRELGESFWPWFTTVAIFGAACVAIYLFFRFIVPPQHHGDHVDELEEEEDADERIALGNDR